MMHILSSVHSDHRTISQKISEFEWWRRFMGGGLQPVNATRQESSVGNWLDASYNSDHKVAVAQISEAELLAGSLTKTPLNQPKTHQWHTTPVLGIPIHSICSLMR
uniref:Uncharacterized protein n=1 Tax=Bionectria ochroleuca TaxID=29856 RepID=A0A8H7NE99_BIOOC